MDFSKLPRMSETPGKHPAEVQFEHETPPLQPEGAIAAYLGVGMAILLAVFLNSPRNLFDLAAGSPPVITAADGSPIPYVESAFFPLDLGTTAFILLTALDGIVLAFNRDRALTKIMASLAALVALMNLGVIVYTQPKIGIQLGPVFAALIAGYFALRGFQRARQ